MLSRTLMTAAAHASTTHVHPTTSIISLTSPFTRNSLRTLQSALIAHATTPCSVVDGVPGVLLELRGGKLRSHAGEVRYDASFLDTALRETQGEVGLNAGQVDILSQFGPPERSLMGLRVWPYVVRLVSLSMNDPLPSISLSSLTMSQPEVATVFHLPLSAFVSPARIRPDMFRATNLYWAIDVSDLVEGFEGVSDPLGRPEVGGGKEGRLEVWGLTGWYMSLLMRILRVYT
ncbi:uncharacterized protein EDB91DRAFT_1330302 [Suillus paluster]|uniref:uncharacterized protein n=1 Tax=Suillus paluster TaxID=48578 RepID=UPI001B8765AD|nr:uncharacterized protein EDB91DRAFT_1330302 [Suillus paluster]KAG1731994.1 hypothetical protein EDB91DRAFT_1330302 [Suillus paluster]